MDAVGIPHFLRGCWTPSPYLQLRPPGGGFGDRERDNRSSADFAIDRRVSFNSCAARLHSALHSTDNLPTIVMEEDESHG